MSLFAFVTIAYLGASDARWFAYVATLMLALLSWLGSLWLHTRLANSLYGDAESRTAQASSPATLKHLVARLMEVRTGDPTFAADLEEIRANQPSMPKDPWAS